MYTALLLIHTWLRHPVFLLGLLLCVLATVRHFRGDGFPDSLARLHQAFVGLLDAQFTVGLLLYVAFSPIASAAFADMGAAMKDPSLRFFAIEHPVTMFIAVAVAHIGKVRAAKAAPELRARTVLRFQWAWLVLTFLAIPWPWLDVGRPLFRF